MQFEWRIDSHSLFKVEQLERLLSMYSQNLSGNMSVAASGSMKMSYDWFELLGSLPPDPGIRR